MVFSASLFACFPPSASQISATNPSYTSVTLNNQGIGQGGKRLQYRVKGTNSWIETSTFTGTSFVVNNLQPGTTYQYQGRVNCNPGWSSWSPSTPKEFTTLSCPLPSSNQYSAINLTESTATLTNTASGTQREVRYKRNSFTALIWTTFTNTGQNFPINGLSSNTTYEYQARVICGSHTTSWTSSKTFTTLQPCIAPSTSQINHSNVTATTATLSNSAVGISRKFRYKRTSTTQWIESSIISTNSLNVTGLIIGTTYEYQASIRCSNGLWSAYSGSKQFTTTQTCPTPSVSEISNSDPTPTSVILYNSASGTPKNLRYRRIGTTQWSDYTIVSGNSWSISGLSTGVTYEFQGSIRCSNGVWSTFSPSKQFTTKHLTVTPTQITFNASNNTARVITVTSNGSWTATSSTAFHGQSSQLNWLRTFTANGSGGSMSSISGNGNGSFSIQVLTNQGSTRTGTVTVTINGITRTINVTQYGSSTRPAFTNDDQMEAEVTVQSDDESSSDLINVESRITNKPISESNNTIKIAPNPTNGVFALFLDVDPNETISLELFNAYGQLVNRLSQGVIDAYTNKLDFDFSMLPAGNYFIKGLVGNKMITEKLIIV
jgi:hypothetical protein